MADDKPLLCFHVDGNDDPEDQMVVFARTSIEAKRWWANEHGDGERFITGISAKRCKGWDKFAPGPVPALEMIESGWWFECHGCGRQINQERIDYGLDESDEGEACDPMQPYEPSPQHIWCSRACHDKDMAERQRIATMKRRALAVVGRAVQRAYPGVTLPEREYSRYVYVNRSNGVLLIHDVRIQFEVPGMKHGGGCWSVTDEPWRNGKVEAQGPVQPWYWQRKIMQPLSLSARTRQVTATIVKGDIEAWERWRAASGCAKGAVVA